MTSEPAGPDTLSPALEAVMTRFRAMVRGVGWRHGLSEQELDELMQDVRLRLWRARGTSEQITGAPASYVYRTAITAALDLIRARRGAREEPIDMTRASGEARLAAPGGPADGLEADELAAQVGRAVGEITPSRRPVLRMYLAGYDREEIAQLLGWSEAKTRNLLYRGLADLRALLAARGIGPEAVR
jgi:RNA polymerase sigma-70 factor (ECF subfamily)